MSPNLALISIPALWILSIAPHTYAVTIASSGPGGFDNRNPRATSYIENLKSSLSEADFARFERAESAHKNAMENAPLYIGAVFAGLLAEQATKGTIGKTYVSSGVPTGLTRFIYSYFAVRGLYTASYILTTDNKYSAIRSGLWVVTLGLCFEQFYRAAVVLGY